MFLIPYPLILRIPYGMNIHIFSSDHTHESQNPKLNK